MSSDLNVFIGRHYIINVICCKCQNICFNESRNHGDIANLTNERLMM